MWALPFLQGSFYGIIVRLIKTNMTVSQTQFAPQGPGNPEILSSHAEADEVLAQNQTPTHPEDIANAQERETAARTTATVGSRREGASVSLNVLAGKVTAKDAIDEHGESAIEDEETTQLLNEIDPLDANLETPENQRRAKALIAVNAVMMHIADFHGVQPKNGQELKAFITGPASPIRLTGTEISALETWIAIEQANGSKWNEAQKMWWGDINSAVTESAKLRADTNPDIVDQSTTQNQTPTAAPQTLSDVYTANSPVLAEAKAQAAQPEQGIFSKMWDKTKGAAIEHPYIAGGIALVGAIAVFKWMFSDDKEKSSSEKTEKSSNWGKWLGLGAGVLGALTLAGCGRSLGIGGLTEIMASKGVKDAKDKAELFYETFKKEGLQEAMATLEDGYLERKENNTHIASIINKELGVKSVTTGYISRIRNKNFDDFIDDSVSVWDEYDTLRTAKESVMSAMTGKLGSALTSSIFDTKEEVEAAKAVKKYLKNHEDSLAGVTNNESTVGDALTKIIKEKSTNSPATPTQPGAPESGETTPLVAGAAAGAVAGVAEAQAVTVDGEKKKRQAGTSESPETVDEEESWLSEKIPGFKTAKSDLIKFMKAHNVAVPAVIAELNMSKVAKEMGISREDASTWAEYAVVGGGALLLFKFASPKKLLGNAALYFGLVRQGKDSWGGKALMTFSREFDAVKHKLSSKLNRSIPGADLFVEDALEGFSLETKMDDMLKWMERHPAESMVAVNGLWMCRAFVFGAFKNFVKVAVKGGTYALQNPGKTLLATGALAALYQARRPFANELLSIAYDDPSSKEATAMRNDLASILDIDFKTPDTLAEKQAPAFIKSILKNPKEALSNPDFVAKYNEGLYSLGVDILGRVWIFAKGLNVPLQLCDLAVESAKTTFGDLLSPEKSGTTMTHLLVGGTEMYVFGKMALNAVKSYGEVLNTGGDKVDLVWRVLKSAAPWTDEWKFVFKSSLNGLPGVTTLKTVSMHRRVGEVIDGLEDILTLIKKCNPHDANEVQTIQKKITDIVVNNRLISENIDSIKTNNFKAQLLEKLSPIKTLLKQAESAAAVSGQLGEVENKINNALSSLRPLRDSMDTWISRMPAGLSTGSKIFHGVVKVAGAAGVLIYGVRAIGSFIEAAKTDIEGRSGVAVAKGIENTAETGIAVASMAVGGTAGLAVSAGAMPWAAMATNAIDSAYEKTKTPLEWAKETDPYQLVHEWLSSNANGGAGGGEYMTAGDAYRFSGLEQGKAEHTATRRKIVEALIMKEEGTEIANADRMHFMETICNFNPAPEYATCVQMLRDSKLYAGIQAARRNGIKENLAEYPLGGINLLDAKYENPGRAEVAELVLAVKKDAQESVDPMLRARLDSFGTTYLVELLEDARQEIFSLNDEQKAFAIDLAEYLTFVRNVDTDLTIRKLDNERVVDHEVNAEIVAQRINALSMGNQSEIDQYFNEYKEKIEDNAACYALYQLAEYFGYSGYQNETGLKRFFTENRKGYFGVYWDGDEWCVNEQGAELDNEVGAELTTETVTAIITELRSDSGNILEHRADSVFYSEGETMYSEHVAKMASILEKGLKDYETVGKPKLPTSPEAPAPSVPVAAPGIETVGEQAA